VSCASGEYCVQGACTGPPASYLSPDGLETQASHPVTIDFSIGTASAATIYYTTDGTDPAPDAGTTKAAASPVVLAAVGNGTTLRWFASYGGTAGREPSTQQMLVTTTTPGDSYGTVVQHVKFAATGGPVVQVAPGATVTGAVDYEYWPDNAAGQCPSCVCQWTLGVDSVGQIACQVFEFNGSNGFPGKSGTQDFSFTAPTTPGVYIMRQGFAEKFSCGEAGSAGEDVGEVVVAL
jgi:hypothetical protein